jgi:putative salt-induced outer membrane protein YdiY
MRYFIPLIIVILFTGHCYGIAPGQNSSTNLLAAVKASTNQPAKWNGTITFGLTATAGNVSSVLATSKLASERKTARNDLTLGADGSYGEVGSTESAESLHGCAQDNQTVVDDTWYGYGRADGLHDAIQDVTYRVTAGAGGGYYFIKNKMTTFSSEAGPAFETEKLDDEYHQYPSARVAENFEHKIDDHARVWQNIEIIPPLTDLDAFLVNAEVGLETPLTPKLSLQTYLQDNFANMPAPGYKDNDLKLVSGIVFKF